MTMLDLRCTGLTAIWCPICGDCTCAKLSSGEPCLDSDHCPLHSVHATHAVTVALQDLRERVAAVAKDSGICLTEHDRDAVAKFGQWLQEKARGKAGA